MVTDRMRPVRIDGEVRPPGRPALPLGPARPDDGRRRERPHAHGARPERAHPGGQGAHVRHPAGPAAARRRSCAAVRRASAVGRRAGDTTSAVSSSRSRRQPQRGRHYGDEAKPRMGFFTDTSVCIGCKACEVACKEWNLDSRGRPRLDRRELRQHRRSSSANTWRHVAFVEQRKPLKLDGETARRPTAARSRCAG